MSKTTQVTLVLMFDENDVKKKDIKKLNGSTYEDWNDFMTNCEYSRTTIYTLPHFIKGINNGEIDTNGILVAHVLLKDRRGL